MKTFRFAVASIHYHKKALILYGLLTFFAVIGLIISDTLLHSLNQLFTQAKDYLIGEEMPAKIAQEIQPIASIYQNGFHRFHYFLPTNEKKGISGMADERSFLAAMGRNAALGSPPATACNHRPRLCIADSISAFLSTRNDYQSYHNFRQRRCLLADLAVGQ